MKHRCNDKTISNGQQSISTQLLNEAVAMAEDEGLLEAPLEERAVVVPLRKTVLDSYLPRGNLRYHLRAATTL